MTEYEPGVVFIQFICLSSILGLGASVRISGIGKCVS